MKSALRRALDRCAPWFADGGSLSWLGPLYEAADTALYSPGHVTRTAPHVRDGLDMKRVMGIVVVALVPCALMALYNTGYQAQLAIAQGAIPLSDWRSALYVGVGFDFDYRNPLLCTVYGALYFFPVLVTAFVTGIGIEVVFAKIRGHEVNEGFFVTSILFTLTLPPGTPLWMAALGIIFGVVIGKEVFGGTGKNFLNPALTGRAFLYFAYPAQMSGDAVWGAVDGYTAATSLGTAALGEGYGFGFWEAFIGNIPGSIGETSTLAIAIAAVILMASRIASWRIILGCVLGLFIGTAMFHLLGYASNPMFGIPPEWQLVMGGVAFGAVFMATDPVSAAMTNRGRLIYGMLIGFTCILIRVVNPAFPEGMMLAILFGNLFAPLIDHFVVQSNIKRRLARV